MLLCTICRSSVINENVGEELVARHVLRCSLYLSNKQAPETKNLER